MSACLLMACGTDGSQRSEPLVVEPSADLLELLRPATPPLERTQGTDEPVINRVAAARLMPGGDRIVLLDIDEPHVRILTRRGEAIRAFGRNGDGPGEIRRARYVALSGDSVIAVLHRGGLSEFTVEGEFLGGRSTAMEFANRDRPGLFPYGLASFCDTAWAVFAATGWGRSGRGLTGWVQVAPRVSQQDSGRDLRVDVLYEDTIAPAAWWMMREASTVSTDSGILFWHRAADPPRAMSVGCAHGETVELPYRTEAPYEFARSMGRDGRPALTFPGRAYFRGFAPLGDGIVVAYFPREDGGVTRLEFVRPGQRRIIELDGSYQVQDGRAGVGVLLSTADPYPRLIVVPELTMLRAFGVSPGEGGGA